MKPILFLLILTVSSISITAKAESAYIYDKSKMLWGLKGPSKEFVVAHKYAPGTKLQIIKGEVENGYTHVIDEKGRQSWMPSNYLLPSDNVALDRALEDIKLLKLEHEKQIKKLQSELNAKAPLEKTNQNLQKKIAAIEMELEGVKQRNSVISSRFNREVFFAGGATIIAGIFFGWIFGTRGRKRNDAWS